MIKKYDYYQIEVIKLNGNKIIISHEKDETKYSEVLNVYSSKKNDYPESIIRFVGVNKDERKTIFEKKRKITESTARQMENAIEVIKEQSKILKDCCEFSNGQVNLIKKEQSNLDHLLKEAIDAETLTDEEKIRCFDMERELVLKRRDWKMLSSISKSIIDETESIIKNINTINNTYNSCMNFGKNMIEKLINKDEKVTDVHTIKTVKYDSDKDRISKTSQLELNYRVVIDHSKKELKCYKKCVSSDNKGDKNQKKPKIIKYANSKDREAKIKQLEPNYIVTPDYIKGVLVCYKRVIE